MFRLSPVIFVGISLVFVLGALFGLQLTLASSPDLPVPVTITAEASITLSPGPTGTPTLPERSIVPNDRGGWEEVVPGIDYQFFGLADPNQVHVARMDRFQADLILESSLGQGKISSGLETVSGMALRYDQTLNFWNQAWGDRNDVVVAINGDFFNYGTGQPVRGQVQSGWYTLRYPDFENGSGLVWKMDRQIFIGECVEHIESEQVISFIDSGADNLKINSINSNRGDNELVLFTPQYDRDTGTDPDGVEVVVEMLRPTLVLPQPATAIGFIRSIQNGIGSAPIEFDHIVLSATGFKGTKLLQRAVVGDRIGISQAINHLDDSDCTTASSNDWTKTYASLGGSYYYLEAGEINSFGDGGAATRAPRTAIAYDETYIYFIVVDGRNAGVSVGMTIDELALFSRNQLGAEYAIAQDGGGSSTMVIQGEVVNTPSDLTPVFCYRVFLPALQNSPNSGPGQGTSPIFDDPCFDHIERRVANGIMMVMSQPMERSDRFSENESIQTSQSTDLHLGPGHNYAVLDTLSTGISGNIRAHTNGLNGVYATSSYWWKVGFGDLEGWVEEDAIAPNP